MLKTKKYVRLRKSNTGFGYSYIDTNDNGLWALSIFLDECWHFGVDTFREDLNDLTLEGGGGNEMHWERKDNKIIITPIYDDNPYDYSFETTLEELNCIMDQWEEILKTMPEDVVLVLDSTLANGSPTFLENNKSTPHE